MGKVPRRGRQIPRKKFTARPVYIGEWLAFLRLTQAELMRLTKLNESYISQLITGRRHNPSSTVLSIIAEALGIPVDALYKKPHDFLSEKVDPMAFLAAALRKQK